MLKAKLIVVGGDAKLAEFDLKLPTTIGRARDATLTLPHPLVSRYHCEVYEQDDQLFVRDLKSLNGTYVGDKKISGAHILGSNELLTIGNVTFRADYIPGVLDRAAAAAIAQSESVARRSATPVYQEIAGGEFDLGETEGRVVVDDQVELDEAVAEKSAADTDTNLPPGDVPTDYPGNSAWNIEVGGGSPPKPVEVSMSAIDQLPSAPHAKACEFSSIDIDSDDSPKAAEHISSIDMDNENQHAQVEADDSRLGSFIKKISDQ